MVDLTDSGPRVRAHDAAWATLGLGVTFTPISPNKGKPVVLAELAGAEWLASIIVWETGELDLDAGRRGDGWLVS